MTGHTMFETHKGFLLLNTIFGFYSPTIQHHSRVVQLLHKYLSHITSFIILFSAVLFTSGIPVTDTLERRCINVILLFSMFITIFNSYYSIHTADHFNSVVSLMSNLITIFMKDPFGKSHFREKLKSQYKIIMAFYIVELVFTCLAVFIFILPIYLQSFKSLGFNGERDLPIKMPFNCHQSPMYDFAIFLLFISSLMTALKKVASEVLIIMLLNVVALFLQHLKCSLDYVFADIDDNNCKTYSDKLLQENRIGDEQRSHNDYDNNTKNIDYLKMYINKFEDTLDDDEQRNHKIAVINERIKQWAILHQDVLKLCRKLILTVYLCCVKGALTFTAFSFTTGFVPSLGQTFSEVFYYLSCMLSLYLLCHMGASVTDGSLTIAEPAFYNKWYSTNKKIPNSLKIIFQRVQTPVLMTAFRSPNFDLSIGTFLVFAKATISFHLALVELQKAQEIKNK